MTEETVTIHRLQCGECGHVAVTLSEDRKLIAMMEHILYTHNALRVDLQSDAAVPDTKVTE